MTTLDRSNVKIVRRDLFYKETYDDISCQQKAHPVATIQTYHSSTQLYDLDRMLVIIKVILLSLHQYYDFNS